MQISPRIVPRGWAAAFGIERAWVGGVAGVAQVDGAEPRIDQAVAAIAGGEHAVEHIHAAGDGFEPAQEEWRNNDLGSRAEIEQTLDTGLDNVFSAEPAEAAALVDRCAELALQVGGGLDRVGREAERDLPDEGQEQLL